MADELLVSPGPSDASREDSLARARRVAEGQVAQIAALKAQVAQVNMLIQRAAELEARLGETSRNWPNPPSIDGWSSRAGSPAMPVTS